MKKIIRMLTNIFIVSTILISNVFSAVVSDNDGSAFITKAEYDSLKNNFQSQIDSFNTSIDSKIDTAISSYLAGINISKDSDDYYKMVYDAFGRINPIFINQVKSTQITNKPEVNLNISNRYFVKSNILPDTDYEIWTTSAEVFPDSGNQPMLRGTRIVPNAAHYSGNSLYYNFCETGDMNLQLSTFMMGQWAWNTPSYTCGGSIWTNTTYNPEQKYKGITVTTETATGEGKAYVVHNTAAGNVIIREYASSIWPLCNGNVTFHQYANYYAKNYTDWVTYHRSNNGMPITAAQTIDMPTYTDWGTVTKGTSVSDESTSSSCWGDVSIRLYKVTDGVDYGIRLWGKTYDGGDITIDCIRNDVLPNCNSTSITLSSSTYESYYYNDTLQKTVQTNNLPQNKVNYGKPSVNVSSIRLADISNDTLTSLMGSTVYMGEGVPLIRCHDDEVKIKCKIKVGTNNATHNKVNVLISDDRLVQGYVKPGCNTIYSAELTAGTEYEFEIDGKNDKMYWCTMENKDSGYEAWIESFTFTETKS